VSHAWLLKGFALVYSIVAFLSPIPQPSTCRLRAWNPTFNPTFFSIDKSQAEMNAIEAAFPQSRILLCDFHRQQAWQRWLSGSDVPKQHRDDLFTK